MLGKSIKHFREKANVSVEQLSQLSNLTRQAIYNYEKNKREPSLAILANLSKILKFNILISEGDIMVMSNNKTIEETKVTLEQIKERFINQFKYTQNILLNEMFGITIDMFEEEYESDVLWRHFSCGIDLYELDSIDIDTVTKEDIKKFFKNPDNFSYWTFEVMTLEEVFIFSVNFNIRNKDVFNRYINDYIDSEFFDLDSEKEQVSDFSELVDNILRAVTYCQNNITSHLIVGDIKVMDVVY